MKNFLFLFLALTVYFVRAQNPGDVISYTQNLNLTPEGILQAIDENFGTDIPDELYDLAESFNVGLVGYKVMYYTRDYEGNLVQASGLIMYPTYGFKMSTILYCHPTTDHNSNVPSNLKDILGIGFAVPLTYALSGYIIVAPDYVGMGSGEGSYHPYVDYKTESDASLDMMRAASTILPNLDVQRYNETFITGYSQGGHALMSTLKKNAAQGNPFQFKYAYPGAGPFDLTNSTLEKGVIQKEIFPFSAFLAYIVNTCHQKGFSQYSNHHSEIIKPAYVDYYQERAIDQGGGLFWGPVVWRNLFTESYVNEITSNSNNQLKQCLQESNVHDWYNKTPTTLSHASVDLVVHPDNATVTLNAQRSYYPWWDLNKYKITHQSLGPTFHAGGAIVHTLASLHKFNTLRKGGYFNQWAWLFSKGMDEEISGQITSYSYLNPDLNQQFSSIKEVHNMTLSEQSGQKGAIAFENLNSLEDGVYVIYGKNESNEDIVMPFVKSTPETVESNLIVKSDKNNLLQFEEIPNDLISINVFDTNNEMVKTVKAEDFFKAGNILSVENLRTGDYTFEIVFSTNAIQFKKTISQQDNLNEAFTVHSQNKIIYLTSKNSEIQDVKIFDISGQLVWKYQGMKAFSVNSSEMKTGIYIVNTTLVDGTNSSKKIILK